MNANQIRWLAIGGSAVALILFSNFIITLLGIAVLAGAVYSLGSSHGANGPMLNYNNVRKLNNVRKQIGR